ncbi:MAG: ABC transporter substrate-binding protein [Gemmatimonadota bacterium]|nr:ABC transporter substrate-binding protein [Gemmatimonadota bacterium]
MRSLIRVSTCAAGLTAVLAACQPEPPCVECGTAVIAIGADADLLLPALSQSVGRAIGDQIFLKLATAGLAANTVGDSGFVPGLAASWAFETNRTIVFRLDPRARWHDGAPVTARDVVFTFDAYRDTLLNAPARPLLHEIDSVTARDEHTIAFHFRSAYPEQFFDATHHMRILPSHLLDTVPRDRWRTHPFARSPVGNGPYRLATWRRGELLELVADSSFFLGVPGIGRLVWRVAPDFNAAVTQLVAGEADIVEAIVGPENVARVEADSALRLVEYAAAVYIYLGFNLRAPRGGTTAHPLLGDPALRRALVLASDRGALVRAVLGGRGTIPPGPTTPMVWIADGAPRQPAYDSAGAARMLDSLGWRDTNGDGIRDRGGRRLAFEILYPSSSGIRQRTGVILQEQYRRLGIAVELVPLEFNTWTDRARRGRFDAVLGAWQIDLSPTGLRELWGSHGIGGSNYGAYASPVFDSLVARASATADPGSARTLWHEAIGVINRDAPAVWLFSPQAVAGVHRRIGNVTIRPDEWWGTLWTWTAGKREGAGGVGERD